MEWHFYLWASHKWCNVICAFYFQSICEAKIADAEWTWKSIRLIAQSRCAIAQQPLQLRPLFELWLLLRYCDLCDKTAKRIIKICIHNWEWKETYTLHACNRDRQTDEDKKNKLQFIYGIDLSANGNIQEMCRSCARESKRAIAPQEAEPAEHHWCDRGSGVSLLWRNWVTWSATWFSLMEMCRESRQQVHINVTTSANRISLDVDVECDCQSTISIESVPFLSIYMSKDFCPL